MSEKQILAELKGIRQELAYIKEHMVDTDAVLTPEEAREHEAALAEMKSGKFFRLQDVKRKA